VQIGGADSNAFSTLLGLMSAIKAGELTATASKE
jgi:hypothetical protein